MHLTHTSPALDRRRRGAANRLRRWCYGLVLACATPLAQAQFPAHGAAETPIEETTAAERQNFSALVLIRSLAEDQAQPIAFGASFSRAAVGERSEQSLSLAPLPLRTGLLMVSFSDNDLRLWRRGAGLDITVPEVGHFKLNFFSRGREALKRWSLNPVAAGESETHWSLGASVDWLRTRDGGSRELAIIPKLVIDVAELMQTRTQFDVCIQYAHWRTRAPRNDTPGEEAGRVPQAMVRWAF